MKMLFVVLFLFFTAKVFPNDSVVVKKDPRLDILTEKQASINKLTANLTSSGHYKGYRLQVLTTRNRDEAFKLKADLYQRFPEQKAYTLYQSPYFKVRFGNFVSRAEAEKYKSILSSVYSQTIYVVQDAIDYTPREGEEQLTEE
jgi:hypothetical protein